jgi:hypothetical protein
MVYLIPHLTASIMSLGQLREDGHQILLFGECLKIWDAKGRLMAKVDRAANQLYVLELNIACLVWLTAQCNSEAWRWHARFGHLNFKGLRQLSKGDMVRGLPQIDHIDQVCDSCLVGKQCRLSFPRLVNYRAGCRLELVHGNLCGPVTPATMSGNRFIFLTCAS